MALLDDFEAEYSKPKTNSLINDFESEYKPSKSITFGQALDKGIVNVGVLGELAGNLLDKGITKIGSNFLPKPQSSSVPQLNNPQADISLANALTKFQSMPSSPIIDNVANAYEKNSGINAPYQAVKEAVTSPIDGLKYLTEMLPSGVIGGGIGGGVAKNVATKAAEKYGLSLAGKTLATNIASGSGVNAGATFLGGLAPNSAESFNGENLNDSLAHGLKQTAAESGVAAIMGSPLNVGANSVKNIALKALGLSPVDEALQTIAGNSAIGKDTTGGEIAASFILGGMGAPSDIAGAAIFKDSQSQPINQPQQESVQSTPQIDADNVLDAISKANELTKPRLTISNGEESTLNADDALAEQKQAEYDAQQVQPANSFLTEFENEQSINPATAIPDQTTEKQIDSNVDAINTSQEYVDETQKTVQGNKLKAKKKSGTLLATLKDLGGVKLSEKLDVTGQDKSFAPGGYNQVFTNKSKASLKGLIEGGDLDEYLPPAMRLETNGMNDEAFDSTEAYDYLADKIRNGERVLHYDVEQEIKQNKFYQDSGADAQSDIQAIDELFNEDEINEQLQIAGSHERNSITEARQFISESETSDARGGARNETGSQSGGISQAQTDEVTRSEVNGARDVVTQIVKRRAAANQIGKSKPFDTALQLAKDFMNGESVNPNKFKNAAILFKNDPLLSEQFSKLHELAKPQAKVVRTEKANAIDSYKQIIANATTAKELQIIARDIQDDKTLTDAQAQVLDDIVFEAQDKFNDIEVNDVGNSEATERIEQPKNNSDLLGDNTAAKQAIADAERAKDTKRNTGNDNASEFNLTGSNSEADQAIAAGAQDLFSQPSKPKNEVKSTNIKDFGEKLEGAKKDLWKSYKKSMSEELPADLSQVTVSKYFPEPDYENLIASGLDIRAIAAIKAMRDEIPTKPKLKYKLRHWADNLNILRETANSIINGQLSIEKVIDTFRAGKLTPKFVERIELYAELGYPAFKSAKGWSIESGWSDINKDGKTISLEYPNGNRQMFINREAAIDTLRDKLQVEPEGTERKVKLDIYRVTKTGEIVIGKKVASNKYIDLKGEFKTAREARIYLGENESSLLAALEKSKDVRPERRSVNNPRVGSDYRLGEDVTPEKFASEFGFRGVQFGNYVEQSRRNKDLNNAYDALLDLSHIIGIPPKAISLNGSLGLAFGARGKGGKRPAAAHYEPSQVVINLTKVNGAGSLGHEWWHSMDNYLSKSRKEDNKFVTQNPRANKSYDHVNKKFIDDASIRPELLSSFNELMNSIKGSDYYKRAATLDGARSQDYWSTSEELSARAFEAYLITKAKENNNSNDYLANIEDEEVYKVYNEMAKQIGEREDPYPYPTADEQKVFNPLFDKLFETLQTKETDQGIALFSRENKQSAPGTIESVQSKAGSLLDGLKNKPTLNVVQSASDLPFDAPDDAKGAIWRGSMYLVADNLSTSEDIREVVAHELIGHFGMRGFFGGELDVVLDEIHKNNPRVRELAFKWVGLNKDVIKQQKLTQAQIKYRAIEEAMAEIAQTGKQITGLKRLSAVVQKLLRAIGLNKLANSLEAKTDAEALTLLKKSELFVKYGATKETKIPDIAYPLFVRSESDTDAADNANETKSRDNIIFRRDELGRIQLTATGKAYDVISQVTQNIADKASFGMATPELRKLIRHFKANMAKAMDAAHDVAQTMSPMSAADRALVSDVVENMIKTGVTPPDQILRIASGMQQAMDTQTDELVKLGMLSKDSAERWRGKYLPRFYNREQDPALDTLAKKLLRTALPIRGMGGGSLKGRGLYQEINVNELSQYEALGWEVRDNLWKKNRQGKLELIDANKVRDTEQVMVWRDFTPAERESMGENRDALFRFVMGYTAMQNDIALGRMFDGIAKNQEWTRSRPSEGYSKVPDSEIAETGGVKKYGNLAGLYVRDDILQHITQFEESGELLKFYRKALSFWKMGKTVLNPVSHMNNVVSNLTMAHFAGVSYWDTHKYVGALRDFVKGSALLDEAKDAGLMTGDITRAELIAEMPDDIKALMNQQDSKINKSAKMTYNILTFGLTKPMSKAYRFEDDFFKYLIYKDARSNGLSPDDAVDYATKYIFNYDDLPKGARALRDAAIPFFAYTYKAVPALAHTAFNYPWRFAAPALAIAGLNALAYGLVAGDDDDDLQEKLAKGKELEAEERKNLPPWMQGKSALGTEKSIRLGTDEKTGLPVYMDISRMIPGGDVFDLTNQTDGLPLPAPIMPSNPVLTTIAAMLWNKDTFTGKEVTDINDTGTEKAKKRTEWLLKQLSPAIAPTGYHADRLAEASAQMADTTIETPFKDYTGYGKDGLPVQPKYASLNTIGIKARPIDLELSADIAQGKDGKELSSLKAEARQLARMLDKKAVSQREYDRKMQEILDKAEVIQSKY